MRSEAVVGIESEAESCSAEKEELDRENEPSKDALGEVGVVAVRLERP